MRKLLVSALLVLVGTILPNAAAALDCQYRTVEFIEWSWSVSTP